MKRIFLLSAILLSAFVSKAFAISDPWGSERWAMWRTSDVCGNSLTMTRISTGAVVIHAVEVTSATIINGNGTDKVAIFNWNTGPTAATAGAFNSTGSLTWSWFQGPGNIQAPPNVYDVPLSTGAVVAKSGASCVRIYWDYIYTHEAKDNAPFVPHTFGITP